MSFATKKTAKSLPLNLMTKSELKEWLKTQPENIQCLVKSNDFSAKKGSTLTISSANGKTERILVGVSEKDKLYKISSLPSKLPKNSGGYYIENDLDAQTATQASIGWALGTYDFATYKTSEKKDYSKLVLPATADKKYVTAVANGMKLVRDLINTPTNDMLPSDLEKAARALAKQFNTASCKVITGKALLKKNFPMIHAVGRASADEPRLIDMKWGKKGAPKITLVGKGVCFDTGGLNLKPGGSMSLMKKDMGGAAHVLGLAQMIMALDLPIQLRVLIPAVENSVSSNAYRPSDVLNSRKGLTVEIDNTDAEGRLVLADALTLASEENPDLIIDFATLTGAARVALGPEIPALFTNNDDIGHELYQSGKGIEDPMWQLPLWDNYMSYLDSNTADMKNSGGGMAGATTAALFLQKFVGEDIDWVHIDTYGWNPSAKAGRPKGGEAYGIRASLDMIKKRFKPKN